MQNRLTELIYQRQDCGLVHNSKGQDFVTYNVDLAAHLIAHGVTVQECCHKAESAISKTGLMCTACHSDIDHDAMFCKYCGAKVMPQPPKKEETP